MSESDHPETIDLQIADVVSQWVETAEENRPTATELIELQPDLAPGLAECLRGLERVEQGKAVGSRSGSPQNDFEADAVEFPEIPDFEVLGELGRGGMGVVYLAKQISLDRVVALKVLPFGAVDPRAVKRFLREAETVASLTHPGIVPVYAVGVHGGLNWYAMQRIDGCPLSQWFAVSTFSSRTAALDEVVRVGIEAAETLDHAHRCGVIHRDVKPGNLLVDTSGKVWLADFGLARRDVDVRATATGAMLGTPRYMSAEQISGRDEEVDARTDIYSLGATLYEMATGRPPFTAESPLELLTQIRRDEATPPRQIDPSIPRTLELVILKCLDKEPRRRYVSAAALADDLKAIRDDKPISARGLPVSVTASRFLKRNQRQVNAVVTSVLATIALLVSLGLMWQQHEHAKLGNVRINTPAGLYLANIQLRPKVNSSHLEKSRRNSREAPVDASVCLEETDLHVVTTPMQQMAELPAGEYVVRLEGDGNHSQTVEMSVAAGKTTELEYIDRRESLPSVDIHNKLAVPMSDGVLAVLGKETFEVFDSRRDNEPPSGAAQPGAGEMQRFAIPLAELDAGLAEEALAARPADASDQGDPPLTFAFDSEQTFQGDYNVSRSGFARIERISASRIDLNADTNPDYLVTAARHAALAAISNDGSVLWKRHLPMSFEIAGARSRYPKNEMVNEVIVGITPVDDLDNDGTNDLVVNAALFDPSGFSRPYIFTLSGRSGSEMAVVPLPTIDMGKSKHWPWSGLLQYRLEWNSDNRAQRQANVNHHDGIVKRASLHDIDNDHWGGNTASSALYVLPPLILTRHEGQTIATTAIGRSIHFVSASNGDPVGTPIALKQPICRGPMRVKLADGSLGVVVLTGIPGNAMTKCFLELCVLGETAPRWTVPQDVSAYELVAGAADSSFPWVVDLDNDGSDEILTSIDPDYPSKWPQLHCYSAETGKRNWVSQGISGISAVGERARTVGDIDRDGHLDFALVGISAQVANADALRTAGMSLVVDFISGRTGQRLGYRDEWITSNVEKCPVVEIDSVELSGNELVCSVVYGQVEELKLSSLTITMDLTQVTPSIISRGLTSLAWRDDQHAASTGRWYRRRSGPYARSGDVAVWIEKPPIQSRLSGESLLASWVTPDHRPRVLLSDSNAHVRCVDPITGFIAWERDRFYFDVKSTFCIPAANGGTDLLRQANEVPAFHDAATGGLRFEIDPLSTGKILQLELDSSAPERFVYALAEGAPAVISPRMGRPKSGYQLLTIDRQEQRLVWSKQCLDELESQGRWWQSEVLQVDCNSDGVTDVILGDTDKGKVVLRAFDGRDGEILWSKRMELAGAETDWPRRNRWPLMTNVSSGTGDFVLIVDAVRGDPKSIDLKAVRLLNGRETTALRMSIQNPPVSRSDISIEALSTKKRDGLFSVRRGHNYSGFFSTVFQLDESGGTITEVNRFRSSWEAFDADIDHDQTLERIDVINDTSVEIRRGDTNEMLGSFALPGKLRFRRVETIADTSYLVGWEQGQEHWWFELPGGQVALRSGLGLQTTTLTDVEYPRLLQYQGGTLLIGNTPEGPLCVGVDVGLTPTHIDRLENAAVAMIAPQADPRYKRALSFVGIYRYRSFAEWVSLAGRAAFAILIPLFFVLPLIKQRRWSLRRLLFAPAIVLLAMICWRSILAEQRDDALSNFTAGVITAASIWGVCLLLRDGRWKALGAVVLASGGLATLVMTGEQLSLASSTPGIVGYWTLGNWGIAVLAIAAQFVIPIILLGRWLLAFPQIWKRATIANRLTARST